MFSSRNNMKCYPVENSFTPCVDILEETDYIRVVLWFVAIFAVIGNLVVLIFTIISRIRTKYPLTVTKFLICNLGELMAIDTDTLGVLFDR